MALGEPIKFRLTPEKHAQYEDEAARLGKPLGTYLRERLEADDAVRDELAALRREVASLHHMIEDLADAGPRGQAEPGTNPVQIETLLLLRAIAGPERMKPVKGEMKRLGIDVWTPDGKED
ncbi:mobilization protein [Salmonella enterica]|nr:mobilization protein [Salmonella enterica]EBR1292759.1 mobilization protein [Salmonella enterica]